MRLDNDAGAVLVTVGAVACAALLTCESMPLLGAGWASKLTSGRLLTLWCGAEGAPAPAKGREFPNDAGRCAYRQLRHRSIESRPKSGGLAFADAGWRGSMAASNQQLAQHVHVAAEDRKTKITLETDFGLITAAFQTVAALQGADRRFDAGMTLPGAMELNRSRCQLRRILIPMAGR